MGRAVALLLLAETLLASGAGAATTSYSFQDGVAAYAGTRDVRLSDIAEDPWDPNANYDTWPTPGADSEPQLVSLIRFDCNVSALSGQTVTSASLVLTISNPTVDTYDIYPALVPWTANGATWNTYDGVHPWNAAGAQGDGTDHASTSIGTLTGDNQLTIALTASAVQAWIDNPSSNDGLVITNLAATQGDGVAWSGSEASIAGNRPALRLTLAAGGTVVLQNGLSPSTSYLGTTDTVIASGPDPLNTNNNDDSLDVSGTGGAGNQVSLISFNLSSIVAGQRVAAATLTLNVESAAGADIPLQPLSVPFDEATATWSSRDGVTGWQTPGAAGSADHQSTVMAKVPGTAGVGSVDTPFSGRGLAVVQGWLDGSLANDGLRLGQYSGATTAVFSARETGTASDRPRFVITTADATLAFTSPPQSVPAGRCSAALEVELETLAGGAIPSAQALTVQLDAQGAQFYSDARCANTVSAVALPAGASSVRGYFIATAGGPLDVYASTSTAGFATQRETVGGSGADGGVGGPAAVLHGWGCAATGDEAFSITALVALAALLWSQRRQRLAR